MQKRIGQAAWLAVGYTVVACAVGTERVMSAPPETTMPAMMKIEVKLSSKPPKGAIELFTGKAEQIPANWYERYAPAKPAKWTVKKGVATPEEPQGHDITSRKEFGDCYLHAEFIIPKGSGPSSHGGGNSGVALQGRYEIQILDSYGKAPESHGCGALYSEKAPIVVASKPAGEWQTYDIIFRAPRFGPDGKVTEQARATVFLNGILVQNNEEFTGMTGIQYNEYKEQAKTGPIVLQGNHDKIPMRNIWVVPIPEKS